MGHAESLAILHHPLGSNLCNKSAVNSQIDSQIIVHIATYLRALSLSQFVMLVGSFISLAGYYKDKWCTKKNVVCL